MEAVLGTWRPVLRRTPPAPGASSTSTSWPPQRRTVSNRDSCRSRSRREVGWRRGGSWCKLYGRRDMPARVSLGQSTIYAIMVYRSRNVNGPGGCATRCRCHNKAPRTALDPCSLRTSTVGTDRCIPNETSSSCNAAVRPVNEIILASTNLSAACQT